MASCGGFSGWYTCHKNPRRGFSGSHTRLPERPGKGFFGCHIQHPAFSLSDLCDLTIYAPELKKKSVVPCSKVSRLRRWRLCPQSVAICVVRQALPALLVKCRESTTRMLDLLASSHATHVHPTKHNAKRLHTSEEHIFCSQSFGKVAHPQHWPQLVLAPHYRNGGLKNTLRTRS